MVSAAEGSRSPLALVGRGTECQQIDEVLAGAVNRSGSTLVLVGGPGVGKTALLAAAIETAKRAEACVTRVTGVPGESALPFAGLHQTLAPAWGSMAALPGFQQKLLRRLVGEGPEVVDPGERFRVALAALDLLSEAATHAPLLIVVDDAHWLDIPSLEVLAFVGRRLAAEPIAILAATRDGEDRPPVLSGLPHLVVEPLDDYEARQLLSSAFPNLPKPRSERVLAMARGNPLAILELPDTIADPATVAPAITEPISAVLQECFAARLAALPAAAGTVLLLASVENTLSVAELLASAVTVHGTDIGLVDLQPALNARMATITAERVQFAHPLVASAIYHSASARDRYAAHAAVAHVVGASSDRGIWHRASAAAGRDDTLADDLDALASRAIARGAPSIAVSALTRASALTVDPRRSGHRLLRAAETASAIGQNAQALTLLAHADSDQWGLEERVRAVVVEELAEKPPYAHPARLGEIIELCDRLRDEGAGDAAVGLLWNAATKCWRAGSPTADRRRVLDATDRLTIDCNHPLRSAIRTCLAVSPEPLPRELVDIPRGPADLAVLAWLGLTELFCGDYPAALSALTKAIATARVHGQLALIAQLSVVASQVATWSGQFDAAATAAQEAHRTADELGLSHWALTATITGHLVNAIRDDYRGAVSLVEDAQRELAPTNDRYAFADWQHGLAVAALAAGEYQSARIHLERILDERNQAHHYGVRLRIVGDLAEAMVDTDGRTATRRAISPLIKETARIDAPVSRIAAAYAEALTASPARAAEAFVAATAHDLDQWPLMRARLNLAHGSWLRSTHRSIEARTPLRAARETFARLGIMGWTQRARQELAATGEYSDRRHARPVTALTAQEWQIASLAADGLTNRQIGQQLFLSHRTVGSHLYHLFPKLGVTSRDQLADALAAEGDIATE